MMFKHEPMLLHVACASHHDAALLLRIGTMSGTLRESGAMITEKRVTVALRGHALALTVPLAARGPLRPSEEYLEMLVNEANDRFEKNENRMLNLYEGIENELFTGEYRHLLQCASKTVKGIVNSFPSLDIWGHAAVVVPISFDNESSSFVDDIDVLVFGGYGSGPGMSKQKKKYCRLSSVYGIRRRKGIWDEKWAERNELTLEEHCSKRKIMEGKVILPPLQGHKACLLPVARCAHNDPIVAIFGGRAGPARPFSTLFLYYPTLSCDFFEPKVVGPPPTPRWGHTFTALPGHDDNVAIVVGGRNEKEALSSVYLLSRITKFGEADEYAWQSLDIGRPLFYHSAVLQPNAGSVLDRIVIFGGLANASSIVQPAKCLSMTSSIQITNAGKEIKWVEHGGSFPKDGFFASSAASISTIHSRTRSIIVSGGAPIQHELTNTNEALPIRIYECCSDNKVSACKVDLHPCHSDLAVNFGSMAHHEMLFVESGIDGDRSAKSCDILLLGGGVDSFAFGPSFSSCYSVSLEGLDDDIINEKKLMKHCKRSVQQVMMEKGGSKDVKKNDKPNDACAETDVIYVASKDAKCLKMALESASYLDKRYRMKKADKNTPNSESCSCIAVPITKSCVEEVVNADGEKPIWYEKYALAFGKEVAPFSTVVLGSLKQRKS